MPTKKSWFSRHFVPFSFYPIQGSRLGKVWAWMLVVFYCVFLPLLVVGLSGCASNKTHGVGRLSQLVQFSVDGSSISMRGLERYPLLGRTIKEALQDQGLRVVNFSSGVLVLNFSSVTESSNPLTLTNFARVGEYQIQVSVCVDMQKGRKTIVKKRNFHAFANYIYPQNSPITAGEKNILVRQSMYSDLAGQITGQLAWELKHYRKLAKKRRLTSSSHEAATGAGCRRQG